LTGEPDPYKVLGVDPGAEPEVIASAHRVLARRHHPDVSRDPEAEARMAEINAAWTVLRDPRRRAAYDLEHRIGSEKREGEVQNPIAAMKPVAGAPSPARPASQPAAERPARPGEVTWHLGPNGEGAAGPPPGNRIGSVLPFGRHIGWSLGEVARVDPGYLQWLARKPEGRPYIAEIERILAPILRTADGRDPLNPNDGQDAWRDPRRRR